VRGPSVRYGSSRMTIRVAPQKTPMFARILTGFTAKKTTWMPPPLSRRSSDEGAPPQFKVQPQQPNITQYHRISLNITQYHPIYQKHMAPLSFACHHSFAAPHQNRTKPDQTGPKRTKIGSFRSVVPINPSLHHSTTPSSHYLHMRRAPVSFESAPSGLPRKQPGFTQALSVWLAVLYLL